MMHICTVCFGLGKFQAKACPLCRNAWQTKGVKDPTALNRSIDSSKTIREDPLMFNGFDRGWDLESKSFDFLENAFQVDGGGVLVQRPLMPDAFKTQTRTLEPVFSRSSDKQKSKFDVFRDRKTGYSHLYRVSFNDKEWRLNAELPSGPNAIMHVGIFKDARLATEFLKRKYGIEV